MLSWWEQGLRVLTWLWAIRGPLHSVLLLEAGSDYPQTGMLLNDLKYGYDHGASAADALQN